MATTPSIVNVYPAPNSLGIPIGDSVTVTFDQEMDESSINTGTFVLAAPDTGPLLGENFSPFDLPGLEDEDLFSHPYHGGYVKGTVSFSRVNELGEPVSLDEKDYTGDGSLWRTVAVFTPVSVLSPNKEYSAIVAGDEDTNNAFSSGVRTRTVFDPNPISVSGTGSFSLTGPYKGTLERSYSLVITSDGETGNATYEWWNNASPLTVYQGITTTGIRELEYGVFISFDTTGSFETGDSWSFIVIPAIELPNTYKWSFNTGSGSILIPPSSSSTSGIEAILSQDATGVSEFSAIRTYPESGTYGITISEDPYIGEVIRIRFTSGAVIDETTLVDNILIRAEPCNGDLSIPHTGDLSFSYTSSNNELTITLDPGQLYVNNIIVITLNEEISDTEGYSLGENFIFYFSTEYTPLYSSLRKIQLDLGPLLQDVPDETIMLAIFEASLHANAITFSTVFSNRIFFERARWEYVTCLAELTLVNSLLSNVGSDKMYKKLGDFSVSRSGNSALENAKKEIEDCVAYWKIAVETGGEISPDTSLRPAYSVKGSLAEDAITVNRQWEPLSGYNNFMPSANTRVGKNETNLRTSSRKGFRTRRKKY